MERLNELLVYGVQQTVQNATNYLQHYKTTFSFGTLKIKSVYVQL